MTEKGTGTTEINPEKIIRDLTDEQIEMIMAERMRREKAKMMERLLQVHAVCTTCGAGLTAEEYGRFEETGCPYCSGGRAVPINLEVSKSE